MRTNFTMIPNIAFDLLTNEFDLVGYQKLLRFVGMGNTWKGGNHALAAKLNMSYGSIVNLGKKLKEVGFIEIIPGDNAHGEANSWKLLDIWQMNSEAILSGNELGQKEENGEKFLGDRKPDAQPYHQTNTPLSTNEQATLSPNEQHKEKILTKEVKRNTEKDKSYDLSKKIKAVGISDDFSISDEMRAWATENTPRLDIDYETPNFIDYYRNKGSTGLDWTAKWRTWMRNAFTDFGKYPDGKPTLTGEKNGKGNKTTNGNRTDDKTSEISETSDFLRSIGARPAGL